MATINFWINLTQHDLTNGQMTAMQSVDEDSVLVTLSESEREEVRSLITFDEAPYDTGDLTDRAASIAAIASAAMVRAGAQGWDGKEFAGQCYLNDGVGQYIYPIIGGAPWFMRSLEEALEAVGMIPTYSFSARVSVETVLEDGTVKKENVFKHVDWVRPSWL